MIKFFTNKCDGNRSLRRQPKKITWNVRSFKNPEFLEHVYNERKKQYQFDGSHRNKMEKKSDIEDDRFSILYSGDEKSQRGVSLMICEKGAKAMKKLE